MVNELIVFDYAALESVTEHYAKYVELFVLGKMSRYNKDLLEILAVAS